MPRLIKGLLVGQQKLEKPFRLIVAGGSGSGKSCFVKQLVEKSHFESPFDYISYIYPDYLDECPTEFDVEQNVVSLAGLPDKSYFLLTTAKVSCDIG